MSFIYHRIYKEPVKPVISDWAGTTMDYGCYAPAVVFVEVFKRCGVEITMEQARRPMGLKKLDHIRAISQQDEVAALWKKVHGKACIEADVQDMFEKDFGRRTTEIKKLEIDSSSWYCVNNKTSRIEQFKWSVNLTEDVFRRQKNGKQTCLHIN